MMPVQEVVGYRLVFILYVYLYNLYMLFLIHSFGVSVQSISPKRFTRPMGNYGPSEP